MKRQIRNVVIAGLVVVFARYALFADAEEFLRFYAALRISVMPVLFVNLAVLAVILVMAVASKEGPQGRVIKIFSWASSISLAAAFTWAIATAKLTTAS